MQPPRTPPRPQLPYLGLQGCGCPTEWRLSCVRSQIRVHGACPGPWCPQQSLPPSSQILLPFPSSEGRGRTAVHLRATQRGSAVPGGCFPEFISWVGGLHGVPALSVARTGHHASSLLPHPHLRGHLRFIWAHTYLQPEWLMLGGSTEADHVIPKGL